MAPSELDFGIMCSGPEFDDWQAECIRSLRQMNDVNLKLLIIDDSNSSDTSGLSEKISTIKEYKIEHPLRMQLIKQHGG